MSHSHFRNLVHVVFSTKERKATIPTSDLLKLWAYLIGIGKNLKVLVIAAGGTENHVHLLFVLPPTLTLAKAVQLFKANSSRWMSERGRIFTWQQGHGAFSVSPSQASHVKQYIRNQAAHHRKRSFEDEFLLLLKKSGIDYDPKYIFG